MKCFTALAATTALLAGALEGGRREGVQHRVEPLDARDR